MNAARRPLGHKVTFLADVEHVLVPTLRAGDVVVLDNLAVHNQPAVPIELAFAKLKSVHPARPRTFDHVCDLIAAALGLFTPTECRTFVRHCGYRVSRSAQQRFWCAHCEKGHIAQVGMHSARTPGWRNWADVPGISQPTVRRAFGIHVADTP
jgi:hypothetical protein